MAGAFFSSGLASTGTATKLNSRAIGACRREPNKKQASRHSPALTPAKEESMRDDAACELLWLQRTKVLSPTIGQRPRKKPTAAERASTDGSASCFMYSMKGSTTCRRTIVENRLKGNLSCAEIFGVDVAGIKLRKLVKVSLTLFFPHVWKRCHTDGMPCRAASAQRQGLSGSLSFFQDAFLQVLCAKLLIAAISTREYACSSRHIIRVSSRDIHLCRHVTPFRERVTRTVHQRATGKD